MILILIFRLIRISININAHLQSSSFFCWINQRKTLQPVFSFSLGHTRTNQFHSSCVSEKTLPSVTFDKIWKSIIPTNLCIFFSKYKIQNSLRFIYYFRKGLRQMAFKRVIVVCFTILYLNGTFYPVYSADIAILVINRKAIIFLDPLQISKEIEMMQKKQNWKSA